MGEKFRITREIGIDAGHRVTYHGSKCRNVHGHRYTIQATCEGELAEAGEEMGMVMDFGFLKEEMMAEIDQPCDHGFICWSKDTEVLSMFGRQDLTASELTALSARHYLDLRSASSSIMKLYVVDFVPTAENLAKHWYDRLAPRVAFRSEKRASLALLKVWETPNCSAEYPPPPSELRR